MLFFFECSFFECSLLRMGTRVHSPEVCASKEWANQPWLTSSKTSRRREAAAESCSCFNFALFLFLSVNILFPLYPPPSAGEMVANIVRQFVEHHQENDATIFPHRQYYSELQAFVHHVRGGNKVHFQGINNELEHFHGRG